MRLTFTIYVAFNQEDYAEVDVDVFAIYGDHGIGSYEYAGIPARDIKMCWQIEDWHWDKKKYTLEQNFAINEACYREMSHFIQTFERERYNA